MSDPFVAEIRIFGFNFAPTGWAFCNGQLLPISQNTALFSLLGTTYGGDGKSTFALPDLRGMRRCIRVRARACRSAYSARPADRERDAAPVRDPLPHASSCTASGRPIRLPCSGPNVAVTSNLARSEQRRDLQRVRQHV